jgi:hypothetical protein
VFRSLIAASLLFSPITYKPEYDKNPAAIREWFKNAETTPLARLRLGFKSCCEHADRLMTKFVALPDNEWAFYPDPACTVRGCKLLPIPQDIIHNEGIHAIDPKDENLPEFEAMRREGVFFIYAGRPTCFWPPEQSDG